MPRTEPNPGCVPGRRHPGGHRTRRPRPFAARCRRHRRGPHQAQHQGLGGSVHDPTDPVGRLLFNVLATAAESESNLIRTREGMQLAKAKGNLSTASNPSSPPPRKSASSHSTREVSTPARKSPNSSGSPRARFTALSSEPNNKFSSDSEPPPALG